MSLTVHPAKREGVWLLLGLAGGTGSGKTWSAMTLAKGLSGGARFGVVDTENGRASYYADDFAFDVVDLDAPFRPERYQQAVEALIGAGHRVIVVDSASHEWDGVGGLLEWHDDEMRGREAMSWPAWRKPKTAHKKFVNYLLQVNAHIIFCFRAAERTEMVEVPDPRNPNRTKKEIVPKRSLTGLGGWVPICEGNLPFELTLSVLLTADAPGVPKPIKVLERHKSLVPLDRPLDEGVGAQLAAWAAPGPAATTDPHTKADGSQMKQLQAAFGAAGLGSRDERLAWASDKVGRQLESATHLTADETETLITDLQALAALKAANPEPDGQQQLTETQEA